VDNLRKTGMLPDPAGADGVVNTEAASASYSKDHNSLEVVTWLFSERP